MNDINDPIERLKSLRSQLDMVISMMESGGMRWFDVKNEPPSNTLEIGDYAIVVRNDYRELVRRANRTGEEVRKDAHAFAHGIADRLKKFTKPMEPKALAEFLESRTDYLNYLE